MQRGEVWWASLGAPKGSEPGLRRPVVVVQANEFNNSRIQTVIVAAITSNLRLAQAPGNVRLSKRSSGLRRESVVNVSQIATVDKEGLTERAGRLTGAQLDAVNRGLRLVLAIPEP